MIIACTLLVLHTEPEIDFLTRQELKPRQKFVVFMIKVLVWKPQTVECALLTKALIYAQFTQGPSFFHKVKPVLYFLQMAANKLGKQPEMNLIEMGKEFLRLHDKILEE